MNGARSELTDYTVDDVATHNRDDDLWIIIHGEGQNAYSQLTVELTRA